MALTALQAWSGQDLAQSAVDELAGQLDTRQAALTMMFCSTRYDLPEVAAAVRRRFSGPVVGCTTAGEVVEGHGYANRGIAMMTLTGPEVRCMARLISDSASFGFAEAAALVKEMKQDDPGFWKDGRHVALLLCDGMCLREEQLIAALHGAFNGVPILGGSAGDDLNFKRTYIYHDGAFHAGACQLVVLRLDMPHEIFQTQHYEPMDHRMVVTEADPIHRIVHEIDGMPAVEAYALAINQDPSELTDATLGAYPLMVKISDEYFVRGLQRVLPNGSLSLYCAIDAGIVLRVGRSLDMSANLDARMDLIRQKVPNLQLTIAFDCIMRRLETLDNGQAVAMRRSMDDARMFGFSTYGEQACGLHMNQTLTALAIGA